MTDAPGRPQPGPPSLGQPGQRQPGPQLVLVATPLGNLADLSPRAAATLASADAIACEDTRRTGRLLAHAGITPARLLAVHEHNEAAMAGTIVAVIAGGGTVAMVSDAGMPVISDPGARVVQAVVAAGFEVTVIPGPSAAVAAVAVSGLPADRWVFEGFLPRKGVAARVAEVAAETRTAVLYEAPHRLRATLGALATACGADRPVVLVRELTKLHEEIWRGTLGDAVALYADREPRGSSPRSPSRARRQPPSPRRSGSRRTACINSPFSPGNGRR